MRNLRLALVALTVVTGTVTQALALPIGERTGGCSYTAPGDEMSFDFKRGQTIIEGHGNVYVCVGNNQWTYWFNVDSEGPIPPMPR